MKKIYILLLAILFSQFSFGQIVNIPDVNFKAKLLESDSTNYIAKNLAGNNFKIDENDDGEIQVSEALAVSSLYLNNDNIISVEGINSFINIVDLYLRDNQLTSINISDLLSLTDLNIRNNHLMSLDLSGLTNLINIEISNNQLTNLNVNGLINLETLYVLHNQLTNIDVSELVSLLYFDITNNQLTNLNVSGLINLIEIEARHNLLMNVEINGLSNLVTLNLYNNQLTDIDNSTLTSIKYANFGQNPLTSIDVNGLINLIVLGVEYCQLTNIDVSGLINLETLWAQDNQFTSIDLNGVPNLETLFLHDNQLTNLDGSSLISLQYLSLYNNSLISLNVKNGSTEYLVVDYNDTLEYVCADNEEVNGIQQEIDDAQTTTIVNSYCSFIPGGEFYIIEGHNNLDIDDNGCDNSDASYPNLQYSITDGTTTGSFISNNSGDYSIYIQEGSHTITPILENPTYFSISPTSFSVNFPADTSPFIQDFCITPLGEFSDLEVSIIPLDVARPGFDANYKIIYKNKGTTILNNIIELTFQDIYMDLISASPTADEQVQSLLTWNYTNLLPFESRNIFLTMNINTPTDIPPVNGDDVLMFEVSSLITDDENPNDNVATLNQTVVNSYDPNDKTCVEGEYILPIHVGEYLHYVIRFENTGTANAVNVVVKDKIDTSKFDISSLTPTDGSHSFTTRIKDTNIVEFIFENIQLPFDDANNDGYVAFKIKTLPTLELNDVVENNAEIYFDFNAPIITNTYSTDIVEKLPTDGFTNTISIFPNPSNKQLIINSKTDIDTISIFDINGKLLGSYHISNPLSEYELDISRLSQGVYFLEIQSNDRKEVRKIIKK